MNAIGAIVGGVMAQMFSSLDLANPYECFSIYLLLQIILLVASFQLNDTNEPGNIEDFNDYPDHLSQIVERYT